ncbi:MAG: RagB/SusD family nutrient uptake outer membrane protein [Sphingobacteriales bacterium]|nr:RagB/SusD family nutrient uptake outer membrane protein [Sphingobacteriales bacterium]
MKKNYFKLALVSIGLTIGLTACTNKLDLLPTNDITAAQVYSTPAGYKSAFAKVYGAFATTGNQGAGSGDIQGIDAGFSDFLRLFWKFQELTTDEAVVGWGDAGLPDLHKMNWSANNPFLKGLYYRSFYQITVANDFIRQSSDAKLAERGISGADADNIRKYRAEARFIRAFQYWALLDLFGRPAFVTDADALGATLPQQATKADLFNYIQSELLAIEPLLPAPRTNEYGRADKGAAWALLARLYLNAAVYTGTPKYTEAITYSSKVITLGGYTLLSDYSKIMRADNNVGNTEAIFTINYDGLKTQNWGGTTFLTHASVGGSMSAAAFGVDGGWGGLRTTKNLPNLFPDVTGTLDQRSQFHTAGQSIEINEIGTFTDGYGVTKFKNIKSDGTAGSNLTWMDIDFPLFRLGEQYLIYAEAALRGGSGGNLTTAVTYINTLRTRAVAASIVQADLTLPFILDERARELYWEGHRRTDLIRFGKFTDATYLWPWKGDIKPGKAVESWRNVFPIPSDELVANPNLTQNPN